MLCYEFIKTDPHDITEILLKMASNTINQTNTNHTLYLIHHIHVVKAVLRGHLWDKEKFVF